jgi:threonine/homoserine/homoserine lactone efflux protein
MLIFLMCFVLAFAIAAPIGPLCLIAIRRSVLINLKAGLLTCLGTALAETTFAALAMFGLIAVIDMVRSYQSLIEILVSLAFIVFGLYFIFFAKAVKPHKVTLATQFNAAWTGYLIELTNLPKLAVYTAVLASLQVSAATLSGPMLALALLATFLGSLTAWCLKVLVPHWLKDNDRIRGWLIRTGALLIPELRKPEADLTEQDIIVALNKGTGYFLAVVGIVVLVITLL